MGDGAKQIGPELFISPAQHFLLFLTLDPLLFKRHGALSEDRDDQIPVDLISLLAGIYGIFPIRIITDYRVHAVVAAHG